MGMAASQARFLQLTGRQRDIGLELQHLSLEKTALTRDMQAVSREYQQALSTKTLKWSNNSGITYTELNYNTLMSPNSANGNKPILLSDMSGRIVLNDNYAKYAELISPSGAPGGDYQSHRSEILSALAGVSEDKISTSATTSADAAEKKKAMEDAKEARKDLLPTTYDEKQFLSKFLDAGTLGIDSKVTTTNASINVSKIKNAFNGKNYFSSEVYDKLCSELDKQAEGLQADKEYTADEFIIFMSGAISKALGGYLMYTDNKHNGRYSEYEAADTAYQAALKAYQEAANINNEVFTGSEDIQLSFYDQLFTAIAEQGWVQDSGIDDSDYLSQMLQNNVYYITKIEENTNDNATTEFTYDQDIAQNHKNIFVVNDSDAREKALVNYEYKKSLINTKESRIDTRMKTLETEQSAIVKMLESINKVKNDNVERTFNLFT